MRVGLIGQGKAGRSLKHALSEAGLDLVWCWSRGTSESLCALARVDVVILAVSDAAISEVADALAQRPTASGETWLHLSGCHPGNLCRVSDTLPRAAGSLHPLCALDGSAHGARRLEGCLAGLDGDDEAVKVGRNLALALKMKPVRLVAGKKALYHAAAVTVAGHVTGLFARSARTLEACGFSEEEAHQALYPLLKAAVDNLESRTPVQALTGPIARGDEEVVSAHVEALQQHDPAFAELYVALNQLSRDLIASR